MLTLCPIFLVYHLQKQRYAQAQQQAVQTLESQRASDAAPDAKKPRGGHHAVCA